MSLSEEKRAAMRQAFRMPALQTLKSRKSSITNAFVNTIIPTVIPSDEEIAKALSILEMSADDLRCTYCGDPASEWDHLRPLVRNRRPTGYISEIGNLVPSCGKCNQSKGNKPWEAWMRSGARHAPATRGIQDIEARVQRLKEYERWKQVEPIDFEALLGQELWDAHWSNLDSVVELMQKSQNFADRLRDRVIVAVRDG